MLLEVLLLRHSRRDFLRLISSDNFLNHGLCIYFIFIVNGIWMSPIHGRGAVTGYQPQQQSILGGPSWKPRPLPSLATPLIIGYAHDTAKVEQAIQDGVNVVCWSFVDMIETFERMHNSSTPDEIQQKPTASFQTNLNIQSIQVIRESYPSVIHLAAIGGWNGPHPLGITSGVEWCRLFVQFNQQHNFVFDGIDWDLEGHDDIHNSPTSQFTIAVLNVMADFSLEAKNKYGMIVSMAPAESYLDPLSASSSTTKTPAEKNSFSLALNLHPRSPWDKTILGSFQHAGRQCYAYVVHRAGIQTFDWISLQLYEAYSAFTYDTTIAKHSNTNRIIDSPRRLQADAIFDRANAFASGFSVHIHNETVRIQVPLSKLVMGVANGWADGMKFCRVETASILDANTRLKKETLGEVCAVSCFGALMKKEQTTYTWHHLCLLLSMHSSYLRIKTTMCAGVSMNVTTSSKHTSNAKGFCQWQITVASPFHFLLRYCEREVRRQFLRFASQIVFLM
jgi:chitinase